MTSDDVRFDEKLGPNGPTANFRDVEVVRTYLSLANPSQFRPARDPAISAVMVELDPCPVPRWRELYAEIGAAWHWHDRDAWPDDLIAERLAQSNVRVFALHADLNGQRSETAGFVELERAPDGAVEIVYFGLHASAFGRGLGAWLLGEAVQAAFNWEATRVWLHTCSLDSPAALPNYLARGFIADRTENYVTRIAAV